MTGGAQGVERLGVVDSMLKAVDGTEVEPQFGAKDHGVVKASVN